MSVWIFVPKEVVIVLKKAMFELQTFPKSVFCMGTFISRHLNETIAPFGPPPKIHQELRTKTISRISSGVDVVKVGFKPTFGAESLDIFFEDFFSAHKSTAGCSFENASRV